MTAKKFEKYAHSVIDVAQRLHGDSCGTYPDQPREELREIRAWLEERVTNHWDSSKHLYDSWVRGMAMATFQESSEAWWRND